MAATKTHDLAVVVGEFTDRQTGQAKKRYQNIGALMQGDNGPFIMLAKWFNPAGVPDTRGGESLLVSCFEARQNGGRGNQYQSSNSNQKSAHPEPENNDFPDDYIPF